MGLPRSRPDAAEVSVRPDGPWPGERGAEAQVEVAADHAEQRGAFVRVGCKRHNLMTAESTHNDVLQSRQSAIINSQRKNQG